MNGFHVVAILVGCAAGACVTQERGVSESKVVIGGTIVATPDGAGEESTRLAQAAELYRSGKSRAALAVLAPLRESRDARIARESHALAGVAHASVDELSQAEAELRMATRTDDWPGYGKALADLGVVLLRSGDEAHGIDTLERAEARLALDGDATGAATVRRNRDRYREVMQQRSLEKPCLPVP